MIDLLWPEDLAPYRVAYYLQPHVGGSESPLTRTAKRYGLSKPRWIARFTWRGGYDGDEHADAAGFGPRLDALLAEREGLGRFLLWDFRRPQPIREQLLGAAGALTVATAADAGDTDLHVAGFAPHALAFSMGDYVGGDGRAHIATARCFADGAGVAQVSFRPPLQTALAVGAAVKSRLVTSPFILGDDTLDDAGANETEVGGLTEYAISFVEDLP